MMCLAKFMETLVLARLQTHIEGNRLIDPEQEGFRKKHPTCNAAVCLVQSIDDGFNNGESTAAILLDLKGAFDRVWQNGLILKLHNIGILGRMLRWIKNFLTARTARCPEHIRSVIWCSGWPFSRKCPVPITLQHIYKGYV